MKMVWVYCLDNSCCCSIEMNLFSRGYLTQLCTMSVRGEELGRGVASDLCFLFFQIFFFQPVHRPCHNQFSAPCRKYKSTEVTVIPAQHDGESRPPHQVCITPLVCIRVSLTWQRLSLFPVGGAHSIL